MAQFGIGVATPLHVFAPRLMSHSLLRGGDELDADLRSGSAAGTPGSDGLARDLLFAVARGCADGCMHPNPRYYLPCRAVAFVRLLINERFATHTATWLKH